MGKKLSNPTLCGHFGLDVTGMEAKPYANVSLGADEVVSLSIETAGGWNGYLYLPADVARDVARQMEMAAALVLARRRAK